MTRVFNAESHHADATHTGHADPARSDRFEQHDKFAEMASVRRRHTDQRHLVLIPPSSRMMSRSFKYRVSAERTIASLLSRFVEDRKTAGWMRFGVCNNNLLSIRRDSNGSIPTV